MVVKKIWIAVSVIYFTINFDVITSDPAGYEFYERQNTFKTIALLFPQLISLLTEVNNHLKIIEQYLEHHTMSIINIDRANVQELAHALQSLQSPQLFNINKLEGSCLINTAGRIPLSALSPVSKFIFFNNLNQSALIIGLVLATMVTLHYCTYYHHSQKNIS